MWDYALQGRYSETCLLMAVLGREKEEKGERTV